jgi:N-acetylneuraminic acid mutarotase
MNKIIFIFFWVVSLYSTSFAQSWQNIHDYGYPNNIPTEGLHEAVSFVINGKAYVLTGQINGTIDNSSVLEYNSVTDIWTNVGTFPGQSRRTAMAFSINGKGYIGGGFNDNTKEFLNDFWEFNPIGNTWTQKPNLSISIAAGVGFNIGNKGYLTVGVNNLDFFSESSYVKDLWEFDPSVGVNGTWTKKADFPGRLRAQATGFSMNNKGYIGTGWSEYDRLSYYSSYLNDLWMYDPITNNWQQKSSLDNSNVKGEIYGAVSFSIDGRGYICTGYHNLDYLQGAMEYNPTTDTWIERPDIPYYSINLHPRHSGIGFAIDGKGYVGAGLYDDGNGISESIRDFWKYDPLSCTQNSVIFENTTINGEISIRVSDYIRIGNFGQGDVIIQPYLFSLISFQAENYIEFLPGANIEYVDLGATFIAYIEECNPPRGDWHKLKVEYPKSVVNPNIRRFYDFGMKRKDDLLVYPNPSQGTISLSGIDSSKEVSVEVINTMGISVKKTKGLVDKQALDISALPNGTYFLKISKGSEVVYKKLVLVK